MFLIRQANRERKLKKNGDFKIVSTELDLEGNLVVGLFCGVSCEDSY